MPLRDIVFLPDPVLRRKAHKVTVFDAEFQQLVDDMIETMRHAPGVGLAAPQVGVSQRLIVVEYPVNDDDENSPEKLYVLANPEITHASEEAVNGVEACLSVPGMAGEVMRHTEITVRGQNRRGQTTRIKASGWLARIFQHEIDHLDGVVFVDRASRIWKPTAEEAENIKD
ncbi:MAG TPA: peptide deformylase [Anaerolineaceae bacterium]|nr:peptide deformylase [Anaerolineaceae bacterium]HPN52327.1 peptide deformylase [Anaerolineaceae bacterium]